MEDKTFTNIVLLTVLCLGITIGSILATLIIMI